jgi:hypothetical protein
MFCRYPGVARETRLPPATICYRYAVKNPPLHTAHCSVPSTVCLSVSVVSVVVAVLVTVAIVPLVESFIAQL